MSKSRGKDFERMFKDAVNEIAEEYSIDIQRLYDTVGMKYIVQPADFVCYRYPNEIYVECKSTHRGYLDCYDQPQYSRLLEKAMKRGIAAGMLIWFVQHKKIFWVDMLWAKLYKIESGAKSLSVNSLQKRADEKCGGVIEIDHVTKRINPKMDLHSFFENIQKYYG